VQFDHLQNESEVHIFSVKSAGVVSELKLNIKLTKDGMEKLMQRRLIKSIGNYIVLSVFTIGRIFRALFRWMRSGNDRSWRLKRIIKAIEKHSVARKLSMGTEVIFTQERTGGVWVPSTEIKHEVSGEALTEMATLITDLLEKENDMIETCLAIMASVLSPKKTLAISDLIQDNPVWNVCLAVLISRHRSACPMSEARASSVIAKAQQIPISSGSYLILLCLNSLDLFRRLAG
jgi:hypothetical protein